LISSVLFPVESALTTRIQADHMDVEEDAVEDYEVA
jgi:hypothetical protein